MIVVLAGTKTTPKTVINQPHSHWKPFSISLYIAGYLISLLNFLVASEYHRRVRKWLRTRMYSSPGCILFASRSRHFKLFISFNLAIVLPLAFVLCVGPLYAPFAALGLAQQHQWSHHCKLFTGEAIVTGHSFERKPHDSSISLKFKSPSVSIQYNMSQHGDHSWTLELDTSNSTAVQSPPGPFAQSISLDLKKTSISATCRENSTTVIPCMVGTFHLDPLSFTLNDTRRINDTSVLTIHDRDWRAYNDAPSLWLQNSTGGTILQTSITEPNQCQTLQICFSDAPILHIIVSLALILHFQDKYATYCRTERFQL